MFNLKIADMIRQFTENDLYAINEIINDSATAYRGIIPTDMYNEPYMTMQELKTQLEDGIQFWCYEKHSQILGVMGIQSKEGVTLIRHAYVRSGHRNMGIGGKLLMYLCQGSHLPILIGTWADASWAINFYQNHGFRLILGAEKDLMLQKHWNISARQVETSVVLTNYNSKD